MPDPFEFANHIGFVKGRAANETPISFGGLNYPSASEKDVSVSTKSGASSINFARKRSFSEGRVGPLSKINEEYCWPHGECLKTQVWF